MKGGLLFPENKSSFDAFYDFVNTPNININYLSSGTFGIVLLATVPSDTEYMKIHPMEKYGEFTKSLIIKLSPIKPHPLAEDRYPYKDSMSPTYEDDFVNEINVQTEIYEKTFQFGLPLCPAIVHAEMISSDLEREHYQYVTDMIKNGIKEHSTLLKIKKLCENIIQNDFSIGIIAMEYIENSKTLSNIMTMKSSHITEAQQHSAQNAGRFALLRLAMHGYNHNDFHGGNIMLVDISTSNRESIYLPFIIDFGRTTYLHNSTLLNIRYRIDKVSPDYTTALALLCKYGNEYVSDIQYNKSHYGWVCGDYGYSETEYQANIQQIHDLSPSRSLDYVQRKYPKPQLSGQRRRFINEGIKKISEIMQSIENKNSQDMNKYPLNKEKLASLHRQFYRHFDPRDQYTSISPSVDDNFFIPSSSSSSSTSSNEHFTLNQLDTPSYVTPMSISSDNTSKSTGRNRRRTRRNGVVTTPELIESLSSLNIRGGSSDKKRKQGKRRRTNKK